MALRNTIAVSIVIVSSTHRRYRISQREQRKIRREVLQALDSLTNAEPLANITFVSDFRTVEITLPPTGTYSDVALVSAPYFPQTLLLQLIYDWMEENHCIFPNTELCEAPWRDPALIALGYPGNMTGHNAYVADSISNSGAVDGFVAYITKFPISHFAYASEHERKVVINYFNDGWGVDTLNRTFLHETCHIFDAPDEYRAECRCNNAGHGDFNVPNRNCVRCPGTQLKCAMKDNVSKLCIWTRLHLGWNYGLKTIDAVIPSALNISTNGKVYFFGGDQYVRYTLGAGRDPSYSRIIEEHWIGWPGGHGGFTSRIDAALVHPNGKAYFFKGNQYIRHTFGSGMDSGYPKPINGNWKNWPNNFTSGIDAALVHPNGKAYFFKGNQYIRHTFGSGMDSGYPRSTLEFWPGVLQWP
jgi:hypothetical protein